MDIEEEEENVSLHSPLVHITVEDRLKVDTLQPHKDKRIERKEIYEEVRKQLWLAGPLVSVSLLNYCIQIISVMFVGHLGQLALSAASMATSFASVTGFSLLVGMASALDTLCGQSYGAKQHSMLGIHMQRAMLILMIFSIPLAIIWANTRSILIALGQDPEISAEAGKYSQLMIPSIFAYGLLQCLNRFLQSQNIVFPMMLSSGVTTLLHIIICWFMVFKSGLGYRGAAISNAVSSWINVSILALYVKFSPSCFKTWTGFSKEAMHYIPSFLRLAIPSAIMVCLEMWSFEMMVLLSGLLPNPKLETSVLSICLNTSSTIWMIPFGLSGAVSTRVSNELGAGNPRAARLAVYFIFAMATIEGIFIAAVMILIRNIWGYAYSNEVEVVKYVAIMLPILAASIFLDGIQCVLSGMARGCGRQKIGALINLGSYYLIGIPSSILFAFVFHIGGKGLWLGIICALVVQVSCLLIITICTDWELEAKKAKERVYDSTRSENIVS
ncbi:PREDICTED: protein DETOXIFICATION 16-like [Lupinus angustifolius]|uniref:protein DETOXIFICATION 16-like n=1 Tax=Lupinus angustifolius TaxID=3871 RepID=UPI00092F212C|nr:PREDICTED: protein DETOXIFICATION 16-like [Lupinus angustifolius]